MKKIITTVGTSLFSNYQLEKVKDEYGRDYASIDEQLKRVEKASATDIYNGEYKLYINRIQSKIETYWFEYKGQPNRLASAEIASILNIVTQKTGEEYSVHLLATDTLQSVLAAELILVWFEKNKNICPQVKEILFQRPSSVFELQSQSNYVVKDLQVEDQNLYEQGFMNLIELLNRICEKENSILNITGGYKSIVPIMTLYGQLEELPIKYIFNEQDLNTTSDVITIGNLPISFDLSYIENYVQYLAQPNTVPDQNTAQKLYDLGLVKYPELPIELSIIGNLIYGKLQADDLPFQKTIMGHFVEYKLYEYFCANPHGSYQRVLIGFKLPLEADHDLEDVDLWLEDETNHEVVAVEIKPASMKPKGLRYKIKKLLGLITKVPGKKIKEFWVILYEFDKSPYNNDRLWCEQVINADLKSDYPSLMFRIKKITIDHNFIDGKRNRVLYQEFMRSSVFEILELYSS